jgi:hypothetical protein
MNTVETYQNVFQESNLLIFLAVFIGACVCIVAVTGAIKGIRDVRKPARQQAEQADNHVATCLRNDNDRLNDLTRRVESLERESKDMHKGQRALIFGVQALLEHELHNGNADQMQEASSGLSSYLRER